MIIETVKDFIKKNNLSGTFIVAFSGGYDSMCLLDILNKSGYDIAAVHLNHNWRGKESLEDAQNCLEFAKKNNIKFYMETLDDTVEKTETAAREVRYEFLKRCAEKFNSNVVFTAHNFDDNAETVLYRIIKGTGTIGLQGIAEHRDIFYRPLLKVTREEIEKYCRENDLTPNIDSSNYNTNYKRNFIRHKILPILKEINPKVTEALNTLSQIAHDDNILINNYLTSDILKASEIEQKRIIYRILNQYNLDYDRKKIDNIQKFISENKNSKSGKKISLTNGLWLFVSGKKAEIIEAKEKNFQEIEITNTGNYDFGKYIFSINETNEYPKIFPKDSEFKAYIETKNINFKLRHRKDGDIIFPLGAGGSQKLKKYLNEKKIPQHEKDEIVLLCSGNEVLWAAGLGLSGKIKVVNKPTHVVTLKKR